MFYVKMKYSQMHEATLNGLTTLWQLWFCFRASRERCQEISGNSILEKWVPISGGVLCLTASPWVIA